MTVVTDDRIRSAYEREEDLPVLYKSFQGWCDRVRPNRTSGQEKLWWPIWMAGYRRGVNEAAKEG